MTDRDDGYAGVKPAGGSDNSALDPFEIAFRPEYRGNRGPQEPFINQHGVLIGDHEYASTNSPLERWDEETDPAIMAGEEWVHPYKDIGFHTSENRALFERGIRPANPFMHPVHTTSSSDDELSDEELYFAVPEVMDEP